MTREENAGAFYHDLANYHHCSLHQKDGTFTASFYPRYQPALFPDRACPLLDSGIDSLRHYGGSGDLANCECGRIHKALSIVDLDSSIVISRFQSQGFGPSRPGA